MNRRHFLAGILAAGAAPAIVRADSLMRIVVRPQELVLPEWGMSIVGTERYLTAQDIINVATYRIGEVGYKSRAELMVFNGKEWVMTQ